MTDEPTLRDIYYRLGAMESKLDTTLSLQDRDRERIADLEDRASKLENTEAKRTGVITVLLAVFSLFSATVVNFVTSHINMN